MTFLEINREINMDKKSYLKNGYKSVTEGNMKIIIKKIVDGDVLKDILGFVWNAPGSNLKKLHAGNDSVNEVEEYLALCEIPRSVAMQVETHKKKHRFYSWMSSARPDLPCTLQGEYSRDQIVKFAMIFTVRGIIDISHYRMCMKAEEPTRLFMRLLRDAIRDIDPDVAKLMMPMCAYRNGLCTELRSCKHPKTYNQGMEF